MSRIVFLLVALVALGSVVAYMAPASGQAAGDAAPISRVKIPLGYRDWRMIYSIVYLSSLFAALLIDHYWRIG